MKHCILLLSQIALFEALITLIEKCQTKSSDYTQKNVEQ